MHNTGNQANNKDSKIPLPEKLPGIGIISLRNVFRERIWKSLQQGEKLQQRATFIHGILLKQYCV